MNADPFFRLDLPVVIATIKPELENQITGTHGQFGVGQFGVGSPLLLPLHQVGKLDSWEDFQD
ncbi:MAG: hypothetical protein WA746_19215, partial [Isosphaeraceae bacterium]